MIDSLSRPQFDVMAQTGIAVREGDETKIATHFRPVRYEVQAEMDKVFGLTHAQRRQMRLRHRDEQGRLWFDGLEKEEFSHLLQPQRSPTSPMALRSPSADASFPSSPNDHRAFRRRRSSLNLGGFGYVPVLERRASMSCVPGGEEVTTVCFQPLKVDDLSSGRQPQPRRYRHPTDEERLAASLSKFNGDQDFLARFYHHEEDGFSSTQSEDRIVLPAFLPLKHRQANSNLLNEAFPFLPLPSRIRIPGTPSTEGGAELRRRRTQRGDGPANEALNKRRGSDSSRDDSSKEETRVQEGANVRIGGLRTGAEVYDGVEIPGASIHLQSDDEDANDGSDGNTARTSKTTKVAKMKRTGRLLQAMRVFD